MKFYLLDDDSSILHILKIIIQNRGLGDVCGTAVRAADALEDLAVLMPDIVVADLLMPEMDGITFVGKARLVCPSASFIMLSQVSSKDMVADAYESGVEFFIQKPVNSIEVETVIKKVSQSLTMQRTIQKMHSLFTEELAPSAMPDSSPVSKDYLPKLQAILKKLGIIGDNGSKDIISIVSYLVDEGLEIGDSTLRDLCGHFCTSPKSMEQRIRRAANAGMVNLAHLGLEDYGNEIFAEYSNSLYNFEQVRKEMDYIRGKSDRHGNVKIRNFLNALVISCQE